MKRVVVISDLHCGHETGITPPDWNPPYSTQAPRYKVYQLRRQLWKFYADALAEIQPIDALIVNGDLTDGKGERSGGTELLTADRIEQSDMATASIGEANAKEVFLSYGTPYHGGNSEDFEKLVAYNLGASIQGHGWLEANGVTFDYKHTISRSSIPHGRYTALAREKLWGDIQGEHGEYPKADVILRSHVHYFAYCGGYKWLGMITPSLQGPTKYGRQVTGTIDFGLVWFDITEKGEMSWHYNILKLRSGRRMVNHLK